MSEANNVYIRPAEADDIKYLQDKLRKDDIEEITAACSTPLVGLCEGFLFSQECYTIVKDEKPIGMFGVGLGGSIWCVGTEETLSSPKKWLLWGRQYINHFLDIYPILTNMVSVNNTAHIKWLKLLGAIFSAPYEFNNHLFQDFYIMKTTKREE